MNNDIKSNLIQTEYKSILLWYFRSKNILTESCSVVTTIFWLLKIKNRCLLGFSIGNNYALIFIFYLKFGFRTKFYEEPLILSGYYERRLVGNEIRNPLFIYYSKKRSSEPDYNILRIIGLFPLIKNSYRTIIGIEWSYGFWAIYILFFYFEFSRNNQE